ncbi:hypothetical protein [Flavobacterium aquatile]|uniref:Uncharacterized protein n=1 Tax=Flavobacterium aquatile LMG 4008 = ATCC 11947 TaxID=1453498 RepID=A0A095U4P8_9FLAO|nr:hypothetical protein [Flavobacterium aquatile]KGD69593.1 hypothetical protein LG45_02200 [Flavobacterium aquatile LMG 4008 = ATCC 11947]OXA67271.1 hypothetical protein B0A61_08680 [Flavobacterium aquatile LMG 4008 = ATCC 11947]GEC77930.1 hypothetical protein FAQ01_08000 [Flavobacterium aquatile]
MNLTGNFDKLNRGKDGQNTDASNPKDTQEIENYSTTGHVRNLCFLQADGKRLFLNYAYLVSGEYSPEANTIKLVYTTHEITLKGRNLEGLFETLMAHVPRQIVAVDKRYEGTKEESEIVVYDVIVKDLSL